MTRALCGRDHWPVLLAMGLKLGLGNFTGWIYIGRRCILNHLACGHRSLAMREGRKTLNPKPKQTPKPLTTILSLLRVRACRFPSPTDSVRPPTCQSMPGFPSPKKERAALAGLEGLVLDAKGF